LYLPDTHENMMITNNTITPTIISVFFIFHFWFSGLTLYFFEE
jgi:membrane protein insertase Oxa1/YidC/SpoIIIJ